MKKIARNLFILGFAGAVLTGCSADNVAEEIDSLNATQSIFEGQQIQQHQLIGNWKILKAVADVAVDLNADGNSNENILSETNCFNNMYFDFDVEGNVETLQARLSINEDGMICDGEKVYNATYSVQGNDLSVFFNINGQEVQASKKIGLTADAAGDYLHVELKDAEASEFVADPGNTVASDINTLELIFVRQ